MFVQQFFVKGIAHSSYLLGGTKSCAVIDPRRDVQIYLDAAKDMGMTITHILETHLHADFISGHLDLADQTGATIVAPKSARCAFRHRAVADGSSLAIDNLVIRVIETPGHTPEHVSYVVVDKARGSEPAGVFCGDTLFVGDVGRPDLFPRIAKELATTLYHSLHDKLLALPDMCEVYPAHGAGSLCGRAMGAKRTSTIGYERLYNPALQIRAIPEFVASLTTNMPAAPDHFSRCSAANRKGPALVRTLPAPRPLAPTAFSAGARKAGTIVLDVRAYEAYCGQHVPHAYHIDSGGNFPTFAGWVLPPDKRILLVAHTAAQAEEAAVLLRRVGLDGTAGYLDGGMFAWAVAGLPTAHTGLLSAAELHKCMDKGPALAVLDVRMPREFDAGHIDGATNIPAPDLRTRFNEVDRGKPVACICSTGHRSSLAASILEQHGFTSVCNVAGGMTGYANARYAAACPACLAPHGPAFPGGKPRTKRGNA